MARIQLVDLTKRFGDVVAVDRVSIDIPDGEMVALLGPSGCGKTTTLRMLAGFERPTAGEIRVGDRVLSSATAVVPPEQRRTSMIFQSYAVWPHLTVFDNVAFGLTLRTRDRAAIRERVTRALAVVRLEALADRYPQQLSGGQQQRVSLARALVVEPETLLLDEPLSNLDASLREEMRFEIRRLHDATHITSVYVTHDQAEAMVTADRIVVMNGGRIEQIGDAETIYERPATRFVARFIGMNNVFACEIVDGRPCIAGRAVAIEQGVAPGRRAARAWVAIRPHDIGLESARVPATDRTAFAANELLGTVRRASFMGNYRDYLVAVDGLEEPLRVATHSDLRVAVDDPVRLWLPPDRCRYVGDDGAPADAVPNT